jgi:hypothetical protein
MEITDGVHWAEQYMRDGTFKAFHRARPAPASGSSAMVSSASMTAVTGPNAKKSGRSAPRSNFECAVPACRRSKAFCRSRSRAAEGGGGRENYLNAAGAASRDGQ